MLSIYERAKINGVDFESTCVGVTAAQWDKLMKGATRANQKKVTDIAVQAGVISKQEAKYHNPYTHLKTKTHLIYVHSCIEHFIKVY